MIIGMVPMALGLGEGGAPNAPLGRAVIGGLVLATVAVILMGGLALGFVPRWRQRKAAKADTSQLLIPTVSVVSPWPQKAGDGLRLPAEIRPRLEASIFARANGSRRRQSIRLAPCGHQGPHPGHSRCSGGNISYESERYLFQTTVRSRRIPKGFRPKAQGCEERATLGSVSQDRQPQRGCGSAVEKGHNPVGVGIDSAPDPG